LFLPDELSHISELSSPATRWCFLVTSGFMSAHQIQLSLRLIYPNPDTFTELSTNICSKKTSSPPPNRSLGITGGSPGQRLALLGLQPGSFRMHPEELWSTHHCHCWAGHQHSGDAKLGPFFQPFFGGHEGHDWEAVVDGKHWKLHKTCSFPVFFAGLLMFNDD
jgi:hypothetical protein